MLGLVTVSLTEKQSRYTYRQSLTYQVNSAFRFARVSKSSICLSGQVGGHVVLTRT